MRLLELVIREYLSIVDTLLESEDIRNDRIIIDKELFKSLLEKYNYMKFRDKTRIYKNLGFIIHDKNNYTLPCKDLEKNKTARKVVINYTTYETIKYLYENVVK